GGAGGRGGGPGGGGGGGERGTRPPEATGPAPAPAAPPRGREPVTPPSGQLMSPVVRRLLNEYRLDAGEVQGTGEGGRITRNDVLAAANRRGRGAPAAAQPTSPPAAPRGPAPPPPRGAGPPPPAPGLRAPRFGRARRAAPAHGARGPCGRARRRRDGAVRQHPAPHRRAHGPLEADEPARVHVDRGRL